MRLLSDFTHLQPYSPWCFRTLFLCLHTLVTRFQLVYAFVIRALAVRFLLLYAHVVRVTSHAGNHIIPGVCVRCPCDFTCWQSDVHGVCIRCPTRIPLVYAYTVYASQAGNHISSGKCVHCLCWQPDSPWFMRTLFIWLHTLQPDIPMCNLHPQTFLSHIIEVRQMCLLRIWFSLPAVAQSLCVVDDFGNLV